MTKSLYLSLPFSNHPLDSAVKPRESERWGFLTLSVCLVVEAVSRSPLICIIDKGHSSSKYSYHVYETWVLYLTC